MELAAAAARLSYFGKQRLTKEMRVSDVSDRAIVSTKFVVLGAGNGGQAAAADLALKGKNVTLYEHPSLKEGFASLINEPSIVYRTGRGKRIARLTEATCDLRHAVADAAIINVIIPATVHDIFFEELLPIVSPEQVVIVWAGRFGGLRLHEMYKARGITPPKAIVEVNTLPYGARLDAPGRVNVLYTARKLMYASVGSRLQKDVKANIEELYSVARQAASPIAVAMSNSALLVLPIASQLNVGGIETSKGKFHLFRDGITDSVARVMEAVYLEFSMLAKELEVEITEYRPEDFRARGSVESVNFRVEGDDDSLYEQLTGPSSINHRYLRENVPYGLVPISEMGRMMQVPMPVTDAFIELGSVLCNDDFRASGRTLKSLGIRDLTDLRAWARSSNPKE